MGTEGVFPLECAARSKGDENWWWTVLVMGPQGAVGATGGRGGHREPWGLWQTKRGMTHLKGTATAQPEPAVDNVETQSHCGQNLHFYNKERESEYV